MNEVPCQSKVVEAVVRNGLNQHAIRGGKDADIEDDNGDKNGKAYECPESEESRCPGLEKGRKRFFCASVNFSVSFGKMTTGAIAEG